MTGHQNVQDAGCFPRPPLTASECRLLAECFLDQLGADPVRNDSLNYLAQHLIMVAEQTESMAPSSSAEGSGVFGAQVALEVTPPEVGLPAVPLDV